MPGPHIPPAPLNPSPTPSLSQHWKLVFQLLNVSWSWERQVLTEVFLKGKFAEQLNYHLQSPGEALTTQTPPGPPGLFPPGEESLVLLCRGPEGATL